jgi:hypothetical protein
LIKLYEKTPFEEIKILEDDNVFDSNKLTVISKFFNEQSHITR